MHFDPTPFFEVSLAVQIHIVAAVLSVFLGLYIFTRRKGGRIHKLCGRIWFLTMGVTALGSFFIHGVKTWGLFSPLHLLSILTLGTLVYALWAIRRRNVIGHKRSLISLFIGLLFAGVMAFSRDLTMHKIFFASPDQGIIPAFENWPGGFGFPLVVAAMIGGLVAIWPLARSRAKA